MRLLLHCLDLFKLLLGKVPGPSIYYVQILESAREQMMVAVRIERTDLKLHWCLRHGLAEFCM